ncbi:MAG: phenylalanine--tRNA ligase subunit beta [Candidatus Paceibacterota bacterium]
MNILIPHHWLLEQLKTEAIPTKIQEYLSLSGPSVERIYEHGHERVYDIEVTTNRVDSMSVRGIAREASVILKQFDVPARLVKNSFSFAQVKPTSKQLLPLPKITDKTKLCNRISCVILQNVQRQPTPQWMADRLKMIDANIHDAAIDITNYATHEQGHPIHAFDYDRIMELGGEIIITLAKKGEKFITLDGENYTTVGGEVVYKNPAGEIIDLPAIKGTANSAVSANTKNILLWIESIDPAKIRFASMTHAIRTVAAQLAEKGIDPHLAEPTMVKAIQLYQELCTAEIASEVYDAFPNQKTPPTITIDLHKIHDYLGIELPMKKIIDILSALECQVKTTRKTLRVTPPTFRLDLNIPVDIIEEIARIYGYHKLPSKLMSTSIPLTHQAGVNFQAENTAKHYLSNIGWQEVYTYSMVSEELAKNSPWSVVSHAKLANSLTEDKLYLRRSLIPSLIEVIEANSQLPEISVFELANIYHPQKTGLPKETLHLALVSTKPFRKVKGDLVSLLKKFYISDSSVKPNLNEDAGFINLGDTRIGQLKVIDKITTIEIDFTKVLPLLKTHPQYQPLPKTASIIEQLTFTLPTKTFIGPILTDITKISPKVRTISLDGIYQQNYTLTIEYWDPKKNLANEDVRPIRKRIVKVIEKTHQAKLVGELQ